MKKVFYKSLYNIVRSFLGWWHREVFDYHKMYRDIAFSSNISKHEEDIYNFNANVRRLDKQELNLRKNVQIKTMYHHTKEKDYERAKKIIDASSEKLLKGEIQKDDHELTLKLYAKNLSNPQEHWEYVGINYRYNTITDRIRRFFRLTCVPVPHFIKKGKDNWLAYHWIDGCEMIENVMRYLDWKSEEDEYDSISE